MKKRKLITPECYNQLFVKISLGVPLARAMRDLDLEDKISRPSLAKLIRWHSDADNFTVYSSLTPEWLNQKGSMIQEQPDNWTYKGYFPVGEWIHEND